MTKKPQTSKEAAEKAVKNIRRKTRQTHSAEEKIRIVLAGLRGGECISVLCRHEGIAENFITDGRKSFWRQASGICLGTLRVKRHCLRGQR